MAEQLTQSQIDALLRKMSAGEVETEEEQKVKEYDFYSPKKFTKEQLKALDGLHENFSRVISSYFSGMLRTVCEVSVLQIEEQRYYEYNNALPDSALIGLLSLKPANKNYSEATLLMDMSTSVGFYLVERLLGGPGDTYNLTRDYTDIEIALLSNVFEKIASRLQDAWCNYIDVSTSLTSIETNSRLLQVFAPEDVVVIVMLSVKMGNLSGNLNICIPAENLEEMIDSFNIRYARTSKRQDPHKEELKRRIITEELMESDMDIRAILDVFPMSVQDIMQLQPEDVIPLNKNINGDIYITVDNTPWYSAKLGETKSKKSVKLNKILV